MGGAPADSFRIEVSSGGQLVFIYYDSSGNGVNKTGTREGSITYVSS
jgi:hypothetical protein